MADENYRDLTYERNIKRKLSEGLPDSVFLEENCLEDKCKTKETLKITYEAFSAEDTDIIQNESLLDLGINPNDTRICINKKRE